ncbi:hypothetical protein NGB19_05820 [Staphylococcus equorum]|uniref:hypothetical protein n=1 Tax=Staphylococcus equorum TaxID=246432 RepID=UPI00209CAB99|nr:hypothetical protein [Staphylococcus equorum]MEB7746302.1 hypothetical protein [Staphylococcus equorum]
MEHINWPFQIMSWVVTVVLTPCLASLLAKQQMKKQLDKTYTNERKSKINDLQIQNLSELHDTLIKSSTVINHIWTSNCSYFKLIINNEIGVSDDDWHEHNKLISEDIKTKVNYIPQIRKKLSLIPSLKNDFNNTFIRIRGEEFNYKQIDNYIKYKKPEELFIKAKQGELDELDYNEYVEFGYKYFSLIDVLYNKLEDKIENIVKEETQLEH